VIEDLVFPSEKRGIAVGTIINEVDSSRHPRFVALVTSDGGEHWTQSPIKEFPRSIFFLNDSLGWMVTDESIWFTEESGRSWKKLSDQVRAPKKANYKGGLLDRVYFLDEKHGFGAGYYKTAVETKDGGVTWTPIEEAGKPTANPQYAFYGRITFSPDRKLGLMVGGSIPPRREDLFRPPLPSWMEPERAATRRQIPTLTLMLETLDGGATWHSQSAPLFGTIHALQVADKEGLALFQFNDSFEWPSEVNRMELSKGTSSRVFREKNRRVTDLLLFPGPQVFLAAVEPTGKLNTTPIPGKVKMLSSTDYQKWVETPVDYKASARNVVLAGPDPKHLWAGTDTGMILHLVP
jgi:hypothetical protein